MRGGADDLLPLLLMALLFAVALLVPALLGRFVSSGQPPDPETGDDEGGGGPPTPPITPRPPGGGLPLDHSRPARIRLRDARPRWRRLPRRMHTRPHEPARRPARHR
jgi:hypothetical protein